MCTGCVAAFVLDSAKPSQRKESTFEYMLESSSRAASVTASTAASQHEVRAWLRDVKTRRDSTGRRVLNKLQYNMVDNVANRVCVELQMVAGDTINDEDLLRWRLHGVPGTGKSHVIRVLRQELLEGV